MKASIEQQITYPAKFLAEFCCLFGITTLIQKSLFLRHDRHLSAWEIDKNKNDRKFFVLQFRSSKLEKPSLYTRDPSVQASKNHRYRIITPFLCCWYKQLMKFLRPLVIGISLEALLIHKFTRKIEQFFTFLLKKVKSQHRRTFLPWEV